MNNQDKAAFAALMTGNAELCHKKISTALLNIYWRALARFDFLDVQRAVDAHVNDPEAGQFMVKPADIVRHIEGNSEVRALQAYSKVESAIRHIGSYTSVVFDDPIIHAVIENMGGWVRFCSIKSDAVPFQTNEFIKRYQGYLQRKPDGYPRYLRGIFDQSDKEAPVLIGNHEKAKQVMQEGSHFNLFFHRESHAQLTQDDKQMEEINGIKMKSGDENDLA